VCACVCVRVCVCVCVCKCACQWHAPRVEWGLHSYAHERRCATASSQHAAIIAGVPSPSRHGLQHTQKDHQTLSRTIAPWQQQCCPPEGHVRPRPPAYVEPQVVRLRHGVAQHIVLLIVAAHQDLWARAWAGQGARATWLSRCSRLEWMAMTGPTPSRRVLLQPHLGLRVHILLTYHPQGCTTHAQSTTHTCTHLVPLGDVRLAPPLSKPSCTHRHAHTANTNSYHRQYEAHTSPATCRAHVPSPPAPTQATAVPTQLPHSHLAPTRLPPPRLVPTQPPHSHNPCTWCPHGFHPLARCPRPHLVPPRRREAAQPRPASGRGHGPGPAAPLFGGARVGLARLGGGLCSQGRVRGRAHVAARHQLVLQRV